MNPQTGNTRPKTQDLQSLDEMLVQACRNISYRQFNKAIKKGATLSNKTYTLPAENDVYGHPQTLSFTCDELADELRKNIVTQMDANKILSTFADYDVLSPEIHDKIIRTAINYQHWDLAQRYLTLKKFTDTTLVDTAYMAALKLEQVTPLSDFKMAKKATLLKFCSWLDLNFYDEFSNELKTEITLDALNKYQHKRVSDLLDTDFIMDKEEQQKALPTVANIHDFPITFKLKFFDNYIQHHKVIFPVWDAVLNSRKLELLKAFLKSHPISKAEENLVLETLITKDITASFKMVCPHISDLKDSPDLLTKALTQEADKEIYVELLKKNCPLDITGFKAAVSEDMIDALKLCQKYQALPKLEEAELNRLFKQTQMDSAPKCFLFLAQHYGLSTLQNNALEEHHRYFIRGQHDPKDTQIVNVLVREEQARRELTPLYFGGALYLQNVHHYTDNNKGMNKIIGDIFEQVARCRAPGISKKDYHNLKKIIKNAKPS